MNEAEFALQDENLRLAYETVAQSGCGAVVVDREGVITYVNRRFCEISGYSSAELVGQNPKILQSGNTPRETYLSLWNTVSSGRTWHGVLQNKKKNGEFYWEAITISPLKNAAGAITHFSAILADVTEEKAAQASQAELDEEIFQEEKRESLAAMAIGMGHDLNNSLASVLAACNLARKAVADQAKLLVMLDHIETAAKSSAGFVQQISSLWKPSLPMPITMDLANVLGVHLSHYETITKRNLRWHHGGGACAHSWQPRFDSRSSAGVTYQCARGLRRRTDRTALRRNCPACPGNRRTFLSLWVKHPVGGLY